MLKFQSSIGLAQHCPRIVLLDMLWHASKYDKISLDEFYFLIPFHLIMKIRIQQLDS